MKTLLLGNGAREAVLAEKIAENDELYSIMAYANPSIVKFVENSNGKYIVGDPFNKELVKEFIEENNIEASVVSQDNLLQEGAIDNVKSLGLLTFGPTSNGAKLEWSKSYALEIVNKIAPEMVIKNESVTTIEELDSVMENYSDDSFVVKPEGLTGGKGVKVGGIHFVGKEEGYNYAKTCLEADGRVIIQDKVEGREFTVMCLTDGKNIVGTPITFDYPYRFDGDKGPGTGGMGCLSFDNNLLPFLQQEDVDICKKLIKDTMEYVNKDSLEFSGVIYGGFFKTANGIKFIEFNARFGDPEAMNVLNSLETPFSDVMKSIKEQNLSEENCKFKNQYTFLVYVVSPDYAIKKSDPIRFTVNTKGIEENGAKIYFASTKHVEGDTYESVGTSRLFAIYAEGITQEEAKQKVYTAIEQNVDKSLDYRKDIGSIYQH